MPNKIMIALSLFLVGLLSACAADVNSQFIGAVENDDADKILELLKSGADVNVQNEQGLSALVAMAMFDHVDVVDALLAAGADVNSRDWLGRAAVYCAGGGGRGDGGESGSRAGRRGGRWNGGAGRAGERQWGWVCSFHGGATVSFA